MNRDTAYLRHILDASRRNEIYIAELDEDIFLSTPLVQDAVIRQLEIVGEATKNLSKALRKKYGKVPWHKSARMRDKLIHHYFGVDISLV